MSLTVGSTFTGVGGIDLAFDRAGFTTLWQSENDPYASAVLKHHWPDVPNFGDIHAIESVPRTDVIVGGFPCQDYSMAGKRGGLAGDRGALWWQLHRLITANRPTWFVGENVAGLLSSNGGRDFRTIIDSLTELGYGVVWRVLDSQWFGVPQRRRRVVVVGHSGGRPRPEVLALGQSLSGNPEPSRETRQGAARVVGGGPVGAFRWQENQNDVRLDDPTQPLNSSQTQAVMFAENQRGEVRLTDTANLTTGGGKPGQGYPAVMTPTVRRLTPLECERLQGFPDGWTASVADTQRYRQMGNAVTVPVFQWVAERLLADHLSHGVARV